MIMAQDATDTKAVKIQFLQSLNKMETAFKNDKDAVGEQAQVILKLMDKEIDKNNAQTEKMMKMPQRSPEERKSLQDQLAVTAKQKYLHKSFAAMDWETLKMDQKEAIQLVRNFLEIIQ